ncbi:MAG: DUF262 domain-containing protein [Terriglobia bacterium]
MRADAYPLDTVLGERQQWVVPVYQRHYEWETEEDRQLPKLWADLQDEAIDRLEKRSPFPHYFGAIIFSEPQQQAFGAVRQRFLVDGQQRITTFQLVLIAIRESARAHQVSRLVDVISAYLFNEKSASMLDGERERFKLWLSSYDRKLYQDISQNTPAKLRSLQPKSFYKNGTLIKGQSPKLLRAFIYLLEAIDAFAADRIKEQGETVEAVLDAVLGGFLSGFQIVVIQLDPNDDAQEIFASLNGLGKPLSPFDLIRNDVFHRARKTGENDQQLFDERWKPFEEPFWTEQVRQGRFKRARADHLVAHAVIAETAREINVGKIATEYQRYSRERAFPTVADELDVLLTHAATYREMERVPPAGLIARIVGVLRIWDLSTFHPLILAINAKAADEDRKAELFTLLEAYIVRREICGLSTKNYNKVVTWFIKQVRDAGDSLGEFHKHLGGLTGDASRMPGDLHVIEAFSRQRTYADIPTPRLRYILEQLEYGSRSKFDEVAVSTANLTIEHVMPQKWSTYWPLPDERLAPCESSFQAAMSNHQLDDKTKALMDTRQRWIDTMGNLTLLTEALNPSISNGPWAAKREKIGKSLLAMNRDIAAQPVWSEAEIEKRAGTLAAVANRLWKVS